MAKKSSDKKVSELEKLHQDYLELKLKHSSMALKETHKLSEARKDIARLKTLMNQKSEVSKGE
ncbi:MAG: 50S ribosomal protein L29 [Gammaproteobacteria bacterium]|jgi:ribosomal protein L29|tara:strand:+ start:7110 stop:7298 length:189 start_codon:yes stop_codon:yes gene_type:complete